MKRTPLRLLLLRAANVTGYPHGLAAGLLLLASSCATAPHQAHQSPGAGVQHAIVSQSEATAPIRQLNHEHADPFLANSQSQPASPQVEQLPVRFDSNVELESTIRTFRDSAIQTVAYETTATSGAPSSDEGVISLVQYCPDPSASVSVPFECEPRLSVDHPACPEPGIMVDCPPCETATLPVGKALPYPYPEYMADEYICDGGDEGLPVHYTDNVRHGLDTEDTVVEFMNHQGEQFVKPSTRTCVYAPRFAAVRSATAPHLDYAVGRALGHHETHNVTAIDTHLRIDEQVHNDEAVGLLMRDRASGVEVRTSEDSLHKAVAAGKHAKLIGAHQDYQFFRDGQFDLASQAILQEAVDAALEWADDLPVRILAVDLTGAQVTAKAFAEEYVGIEDKRTDGDLTIVKIADRKTAQPGEIVTFTIRFDNIGDRELLGVRVVDNLSPRLQYVEGSADSDRNGQLGLESNGAGGTLLTFEFSEPLPGQTGGYISFQCRVR